MYSRPQAYHDLAHAHRRHAELHQYHAQAHQQQSQFHQQQAQLHQQHANMLNNQAFGQSYDERHTAYANQVSPVALVYHGQVSPQAMASLQQFHQPFAGVNPTAHLSNHMAHATENHNAMNRGHRF